MDSNDEPLLEAFPDRSQADFRRRAPLPEEESSDTCSCCGRSKRQGSFFAIVPTEEYTLYNQLYVFGSWEAKYTAFSLAANQGCRRCHFVFLACVAYATSIANFIQPGDIVRVKNSIEFGSGNPIAQVLIRFKRKKKSLKSLEILVDHG